MQKKKAARNIANKQASDCEHFHKCVKYNMLRVEYVQGGLLLYCHALANVCVCVWREAGVRPAFDSSLNVMDNTPLPCDVHAHLMLKWPIHGTIVFQSCRGKVQNRAHFLLHGVITMP